MQEPNTEPLDDLLDLPPKGRRYKSNDPRVIISNAKKEQELLEKRQKIKDSKQMSQMRKELAN